MSSRLGDWRKKVRTLFATRQVGLVSFARMRFSWRRLKWCRGPESNWLRPPFQGGALPVSYPGTVESANFRGAPTSCQMKAGNSTWRGAPRYHAKTSRKETNCQEIRSERRPRTGPENLP